MLALWALIFRSPRLFRPFLVLVFALFFLAVAYHSAMQLHTSLERSHHARSLRH